MAQSQNKQGEPLSNSQKWIFRVIMVLIPVFILVLLEVMLRLVHFGYDLSLFRKSETLPGYYELNPHVSKRFFSKFNGTSPSNDVFLIQKPDTAYRVFVMGCSTTAGFPYEANVSFSRILYFRLKDAFPDKRIEVVNTAMAAVNSYTQADFIDEILAQKPDAILIYTGHNEFYGALGVGSVESVGNVKWMIRLHLKLIRFRTYQMVQRTIGGVLKIFANDAVRPTGTLMENIVKNKAIPYGSDIYKAGMDQFQDNMGILLKKATEANVPVVFGNLVSNIRMRPFASIEANGQPKAADVYQQAEDAEKNSDFEKAKVLYYKAKDLDGIRFRASEDINNIIFELSNQYKVHFLDVKKIFEQASKNGIIDDKLMIEHLHPNVDGYFLLSDAFFNEMKNIQLISATWDTANIKPIEYYRTHWGFTELDSLAADLGIKTLKAGWPFKPENVENRFIYEYKPTSYMDSVATLTVKYDDISVESEHIQLAKHFASQGNFHQAFLEYYSLAKTSPYLNTYYIEGLQYLQKLNNPQLEIEFLKSYPDIKQNFYLSVNLGNAYEKTGQDKMALINYENAQKIFDAANDNAELLYHSLYNIYKKLELTEKANAALSELKKVNPSFNENSGKQQVVVLVDKDIKDLIAKSTELARAGKFNDALDLLEQSIKIKESAIAYQIMGSIYFQLKDERAFETFEKSYKLNPADENTLNNLIVLALMQKRYREGKKYLDEFNRVSGDEGRKQRLNGMYDKAIHSN